MRIVQCAAAMPMPQIAVAAVERSPATLVVKTSHQKRGGPSVTIGTIGVSGTLSSGRVLAVLGRYLDSLGTCYMRDPAVTKAVVQYRITIAHDGSVAAIEGAGATTLGVRLDGCIKRVIRAATFPPPPGGGTSLAMVPLIFDATGAAEEPELLQDGPEPWTPFARDTATPGPAAIGAARATEAALRGKLSAIGACFGATTTGSLRVMLEIGVGGSPGIVRAGGLGDAKGEACVKKALHGMKVVTPVDEHVEVACDLARGDARPWRVALEGYGVIDIEPGQLRHGTATLVPGVTDPTPLPPNTYVVVARPDTPGAMLQLALMWASEAGAVLLAVRDSATAPMFLGIGDTATSHDGNGLARASLRVNRTAVIGCAGRTKHEAKLDGVGAVAQAIATKCRSLKCAPALLVAIDSDARAIDLLEVASAARRAGFDRVLLGSHVSACDDAPAPKKPRHGIDEFELE